MNGIYVTVLRMLKQRGYVARTDGSDYIKAGVVDSLGLLEWVLELEDQFDVELTDDDVASGEFRTVEGLANLIERKMR